MGYRVEDVLSNIEHLILINVDFLLIFCIFLILISVALLLQLTHTGRHLISFLL